MPATVVLGTQWGDEGKGKAVDYLADRMDFVVRYQGGNNAGHTVVAEGRLLKLQLIPSGILYDHITPVIADGVVVDPRHLLTEMEALREAGVDVSRLVVSGNASGWRKLRRRTSAGSAPISVAYRSITRSIAWAASGRPAPR